MKVKIENGTNVLPRRVENILKQAATSHMLAQAIRAL